MKCPSCATEAAGDECPSCGLIFSKWKQRQEREKLEAAAALALIEAGPSLPPNRWTRRGLALFIVAAWTVGLAVVYYRYNSVVKSQAAARTEPPAEYRDPATGKMVLLKAVPAAKPEPAAAPEPAADKEDTAPANAPSPVNPSPEPDGTWRFSSPPH